MKDKRIFKIIQKLYALAEEYIREAHYDAKFNEHQENVGAEFSSKTRHTGLGHEADKVKRKMIELLFSLPESERKAIEVEIYNSQNACCDEIAKYELLLNEEQEKMRVLSEINGAINTCETIAFEAEKGNE